MGAKEAKVADEANNVMIFHIGLSIKRWWWILGLLSLHISKNQTIKKPDR